MGFSRRGRQWGYSVSFAENAGSEPEREEMDAFFAARAPRTPPENVARYIRVFNKSGRASILFRLFMLVFGLGFCIPGFLFYPWSSHIDGRMRRGEAKQAQGRILEISRLSSSVNGQHIYAVSIAFRTADGHEQRAQCYISGRENIPGAADGRFSSDGAAREPVEVPVLYYPPDPQYAIIRGARTHEMPRYFGVIFLTVGSILVLTGLLAGRKARRAQYLLRHGEAALAEVEYIKELNIQINNQHASTVGFGFSHPGGRQTVKRLLYGAAADYVRSRAHQKYIVRLLYDPARPKRFLIVDMVPPEGSAGDGLPGENAGYAS